MVLDERCVLCGEAAAVRVRGTSFCAACGLGQYSNSASSPRRLRRRSRRAAFLAVFSSGLFVKVLLGAVALAAVGGAAAATVIDNEVSEPRSPGIVADQTIPTTIPETAAAGSAVVALTTTDSVASPTVDAAVAEYVAAVRAWADCISGAASTHIGTGFDPDIVCPDTPYPGDFGLAGDPADPPAAGVDPGDSENAPGHDGVGPGNSESAPGHDGVGPGNSESAPGHDGVGPGNSENAPGHDDAGPGNSENAPGFGDGGSGNSDKAPGTFESGLNA